MTVRIIRNPAGVDALVRTPQAKALVVAGAKAVAFNAAQIVPVDKGFSRDGYTSTGAEVTPEGVKATAYTAEVTGHLFEFGSVNTPTLAPLRRGAERAGFRTRLTPKGSA